MNLELDDVRWYLCSTMARELIAYQNRVAELTIELWSGRIADRLHDMEEQFLADLGTRIDAGHSDETRVMEILGEMKIAQRRRPRN